MGMGTAGMQMEMLEMLEMRIRIWMRMRMGVEMGHGQLWDGLTSHDPRMHGSHRTQ